MPSIAGYRMKLVTLFRKDHLRGASSTTPRALSIVTRKWFRKSRPRKPWAPRPICASREATRNRPTRAPAHREDEAADLPLTCWHTLPHRGLTRSTPRRGEAIQGHIGIEVHTKDSQICILAEGGELIDQRIRTEPERFAAVLGERPRVRARRVGRDDHARADRALLPGARTAPRGSRARAPRLTRPLTRRPGTVKGSGRGPGP